MAFFTLLGRFLNRREKSTVDTERTKAALAGAIAGAIIGGTGEAIGELVKFAAAGMVAGLFKVPSRPPMQSEQVQNVPPNATHYWKHWLPILFQTMCTHD